MAVFAILIAVFAATALWVGSGRGPTPPPLLRQFAGALGIAAQADLPADWTLDGQPPEKPADLSLGQPLGALPEPFTTAQPLAAWKTWQQGKLPEALKLAEEAWKKLDAGKRSEERQRLAMLLTQLRWLSGDRSGALQMARQASAHPALGIAVLRWIVARADEAGLSSVALTLVGDRAEPGLLLYKAKALRRNGDREGAARLLASIDAPIGTGLGKRLQVERVRAALAAGDDDKAMELLRQGLAKAGKSAAAEELVDLLLGSGDTVWQNRLKSRPQDAAAVLDALVYSAQRRRYTRAMPALEALAAQAGVSKAVRCHATSWAAKCRDRRAEFDKSVVLLEKLDGCAGDAEVGALAVDEDPLGKGDVAYRTGRALALQGKAEAKKWLQQAIDQGISGLDGDDAKTLLSLMGSTDALAVLEKQGPVAAQDYAERDMVDVAVWRVALQRMIDSKWKEALPLLDRLAEVRDRDALPKGEAGESLRYDDRDWGRGRADYFAGRALHELGKREQAEGRWKRVVTRHPLSYYASMAMAQLQAHAKLAPKDVIDDRSITTGPQVGDAVLADPGVQRARLLGQLGWHDEAGEELDAAGLGRDTSANLKWQTGDPGKVWTRAALDAEAGRWVSSHAIGRDVLRAYATAYPGDGNRQAWEVAFPRAYSDLMQAAAKEFELHPSILYSICRSESGFNPKVESSAHAIGLLQLILPTAKEMAKGLGVEANEATLRQPAVNIRLGAKYLKRLLDRFEREQQMAAGYNAGGGAVGRWRKQRGDWPMDLFVETIPFRETRDYAKRVTSSIATYRALYYGEPLYALGLTQKALPTAEEPATEPKSGQASPAGQNAQVVKRAQPAPVEAEAIEPATAPEPRHHPRELRKQRQRAEQLAKILVERGQAPRGHAAKGRAGKRGEKALLVSAVMRPAAEAKHGKAAAGKPGKRSAVAAKAHKVAVKSAPAQAKAGKARAHAPAAKPGAPAGKTGKRHARR
ncbi:MAG: lytic transglycosylase domain-containing protein [Deltaproteobacteria bacterium]|nr:lytic transglycosylase domain-containing protein [Deltaproteobacteria bacterium]